jgi:hypothetical protein
MQPLLLQYSLDRLETFHRMRRIFRAIKLSCSRLDVLNARAYRLAAGMSRRKLPLMRRYNAISGTLIFLRGSPAPRTASAAAAAAALHNFADVFG